jgi:hypothetical protein
LSALAEALHRFDPPWIEVGRVYRRICLLRSEGLAREAKLAEDTEFAEAASRVRGDSATEAVSLAQLRALMTEEEERVCEAIAFAEVLAPMLARRLSDAQPPRFPPASAPRAGRAGAPGETRGIADFIDDMLAQDRTNPR